MKTDLQGRLSKTDNGILIKCISCGTNTLFKMLRASGEYPCKYCGCSRIFRNPEKLKELFEKKKK